MKALKSVLLGMALLMSTAAGAAVDINTADAKTLEKLAGIGPAKAQAIIEYRTKNGPFTSVNDLGKVEGIGEKTLKALATEVTVGKTPAAPK